MPADEAGPCPCSAIHTRSLTSGSGRTAGTRRSSLQPVRTVLRSGVPRRDQSRWTTAHVPGLLPLCGDAWDGGGMADVLFVTWDGGGNVPPALGLAAELAARGHAVRFLGHAQQRASIESAGFDFSAYVHARAWSSTAPNAGLAGAARIFAMFTDDGPGTDLLAELARRPADLLVVDCMSLGALRAAERAGVRRVVLVHTYYRFLTHVWSRGPIGMIARTRGQHPRRLWDGADLVLVAADRQLDPAEDQHLPASLHHIGVVQPAPVPADGDRDGPDVLVSLSTTFFPGQDRALQTILDALAPLPVRALVTTGDAVDPGMLRPPRNVDVRRYRPHGEVMPTVRMVIGHGGHATTMRALSHDLPILIMPMHPMLDQKMIGQSVEEHGAGLLLPKTATAERIRTAARTLLESETCAAAAAAVGSRLRAHSGAGNGADRLTSVLADR
jgi:UDP:flavonoid glycosyltransferase YjiC (YdhE family)